MTRGTGTLYLSRTQGPGDFISLIDERAWLFEYGFYVAGQYHFLRESDPPWSSPASRDRVSRAAFIIMILVFIGMAITPPSSGAFLVSMCIGIPAAILLVWGSR